MSPRIEALRKKPADDLVDRLERLIDEVVDRLHRREPCDELIATINQLAGGRDYDQGAFFELYGATTSRKFAEILARGQPPVTADLTHEELIEIVEVLMSGQEPDVSFFLDYLGRCFPGSFDSDLIFWPHKEMTPRETVDELLLREDLHRRGGWVAVNGRKVELAKAVLADPNSPLWALQWANGIPIKDAEG